MNKEAIASTNAPPAIGPCSPSIKLGDALFLSGQLVSIRRRASFSSALGPIANSLRKKQLIIIN